MQDIFVSTLTERLSHWVDAFPESKIVADFSNLALKLDATTDGNDELVFWLHVNQEGSAWLSNMISNITNQFKFAKVIVLANAPNQADCFSALSTGAVGYAHTYSSAAMLSEIKTVIGHGGLWLGQELLQRLIETSTKLVSNQPAYVDGLLAQLTSRERDVAIEVAKGLSNKEVARVLNITERTVKAHLAATFERLGAKDRLQLALMLNKR
ncbi:MAG: response regulator transcription factor [Methylotenera sp.]|uniref:response regulator transcription factor n=1 Tax=Methylotenera sp. TaxID=2051956 RepID=UPI00271DE297|nr:response regulator transcription factor [Methylotenera sp.]MDO9150847.1 response regulator transcription factor [Methylotenera sp.]